MNFLTVPGVLESLGRLHEPVARQVPLRAVEIVLNIALFVPLGAVVAWMGRARWLWALVGFSVTIGVVQLWLPQRQSEAIDVATNTIGGVLGYLLVRAIQHWRAGGV